MRYLIIRFVYCMRVLHCLSQLPTRTGSGVYYRNLVREIKKQRGWEQAGLFALNAEHHCFDVELDRVYPVCFESEELPFPMAGMSDEMPYDSTVYSHMTADMLKRWKNAFRSKLTEIKGVFKPDVIICHHLWILCALVLDVFPDIPVIAISHGTDIRQAVQNPSLVKKHVGSLRQLRKVLALSQSDIASIQELFDIRREQITVTGGAYDPSVFYACPEKASCRSDSPLRLLYAGKITESKGVFELVAAYRKVRQIHPDLLLDLVGREDRRTLDRIKEISGHDPTIRVFDAETQSVLADHMRCCDLFVFPSYYEGMGLIAIEALASGLHLVSNMLPGLREQLGQELIEDPAICWVELPPLKNLDEIVDEARSDYIDALAEAICFQIEYLKARGAETKIPFEMIAKCSWDCLVNKIISEIENIT